MQSESKQMGGPGWFVVVFGYTSWIVLVGILTLFMDAGLASLILGVAALAVGFGVALWRRRANLSIFRALQYMHWAMLPISMTVVLLMQSPFQSTFGAMKYSYLPPAALWITLAIRFWFLERRFSGEPSTKEAVSGTPDDARS